MATEIQRKLDDASAKAIAAVRLNDSDTGSSAVQVALLTNRINELVGHLKIHRKDHSTRRGLLKMVGRRRRLLTYLYRTDRSRFESVTEMLSIKTASLVQ